MQNSSAHRSHTRRRSTLTRSDNAEGGHVALNQEPVDDFDDFAEEQDEMGEDDFGDFDDGFQGPGEIAADEAMDQASMTPQQPATPPSVVSSFNTSVDCSSSTLRLILIHAFLSICNTDIADCSRPL